MASRQRCHQTFYLFCRHAVGPAHELSLHYNTPADLHLPPAPAPAPHRLAAHLAMPLPGPAAAPAQQAALLHAPAPTALAPPGEHAPAPQPSILESGRAAAAAPGPDGAARHQLAAADQASERTPAPSQPTADHTASPSSPSTRQATAPAKLPAAQLPYPQAAAPSASQASEPAATSAASAPTAGSAILAVTLTLLGPGLDQMQVAETERLVAALQALLQHNGTATQAAWVQTAVNISEVAPGPAPDFRVVGSVGRKLRQVCQMALLCRATHSRTA